MPAAARVDDPITHTESQAQATTEMWEGIGAGIVIGAALIALTVFTGGADLVVLGAIVAAGGTVLSMGGKGFLQGAKHGQQKVAAHGKVKTGSGSVTINRLAAAAACLSTVQCDEHSGPQKVAEGSRTVSINGRMASRVGDRTVCDAVIGAGSDNVSIGGATGQCAAIHKEVADWEKTLAKGAIVVGTVAQVVGMILTGVGAVRMVTMAPAALRAMMMTRMGAGLVGSLGLGTVGSNYGGRKYGEGSWQQEAFGTGAGLFGGFAGDAMASGGPRIIGGIKSGFEGLTEPGGVFGPGGMFGGGELAPAGGPRGFGLGGEPEIVPRAPGSPGMDAWNPPKSEPMQMTGAGGGSAGITPELSVVQPKSNGAPFAQRSTLEPLPEDPALRQQMLSQETAQTRANSGVPRSLKNGKENGGCVGVARTDIPGLQDRIFEGGSRYAGDTPDDTFIHGDGSINRAQSHAEQNLAGEFDKAIKSETDAKRLTAADLDGKNVYIHTELPTCASCKWGINTPGAPPAKLGVPMKLSQAYPDVTFTYTSDGAPDQVLVIKNGVATKQ